MMADHSIWAWSSRARSAAFIAQLSASEMALGVGKSTFLPLESFAVVGGSTNAPALWEGPPGQAAGRSLFSVLTRRVRQSNGCGLIAASSSLSSWSLAPDFAATGLAFMSSTVGRHAGY